MLPEAIKSCYSDLVFLLMIKLIIFSMKLKPTMLERDLTFATTVTFGESKVSQNEII